MMDKRRETYLKDEVESGLRDMIGETNNIDMKAIASDLVDEACRNRYNELMHKGPTWLAWEYKVCVYDKQFATA